MYAIYNRLGERLYQYGTCETFELASHIANKVNETRPQLGANVREIIDSKDEKLRKAENIIGELVDQDWEASEKEGLTPEKHEEIVRLLKEARKLIIKAIEIKQ